ncbi:MAG: branched-chain amino acid ABC transporter permease [Rhodospirillales bacterium]|nr:branched-chain amino acid ABC transporter permease [Rhodospirillales bacterium]MDE2199636.1 branched-chain amino acid ABC transporter permease [Rhodospirillales bacterium]
MTGGLAPYLVSVGTMIAIYAIAALGLNLQFGIGGLFNVGCTAFIAVGAYASAIVTGPHYRQGLGGFGLALPVGLLAAAAAGALLALLVAAMVLRLRGDYLAIASFGLATAVQIAATNAGAITGGPGGLFGIPLRLGQFWPDAAGPGAAWANVAWLGVCAALAAAAFMALRRLDRAPWGRDLRAVSEDPEAADAAGRNVAAFRLQAFVIGAALMGVAGGLYAHTAGFISPQDFLPILTFQLYAMVIVGGAGRHAGALLGTAVVWLLWSGSGELLAAVLPAQMQANSGAIRVIAIAVVMLAMLLQRPEGLLPERVGRR